MLLHDIPPSDPAAMALLEWCEKEKALGRIRYFGFGLNDECAAQTTHEAEVLQIPALYNSFSKTFSGDIKRPLLILHSILRPLLDNATARAQLRVLEELRVAVRSPTASLGEIVLRVASTANPHGVTLFGVSREEHLPSVNALLPLPLAGFTRAVQILLQAVNKKS